MKAFISTVPFGTTSRTPITLLEEAGIEYVINPLNRKIKPEEVLEYIKDCEYYIAGTEQITKATLDAAPNLKLISRVGVGIDNVPFEVINERGIAVAYTPMAPREAVAELCVGLILDGLRRFSLVDRNLHKGEWNKYMGGLLSGRTVGIIGCGRIGKRLAELLVPFGATVIVNDPAQDEVFAQKTGVEYVSLEELLAKADVVSLNLSASAASHYLLNAERLAAMKSGAILINTSRGEVVDEIALADALTEGPLACAAIDVFEKEPYQGPLQGLPNVILTAHIGAATVESRSQMETEAVKEVIRFHKGEALLHPVTSNN